MNRKFLYALAGLSISAAFAACNSHSSDNGLDTTAYSAMVTDFRFSADSKVCQGLDSVFFSIDQLNLTIFNADSLPVGSPLNKLVPVISTAGASAIEVIQPRAGRTDTIYNFVENSTDSVDFTQGPVKVRIISLDGGVSSTYTIKVNVHNSVPDTLIWTRLEQAGLPTSLAEVEQQHTTRSGDAFWCLTRTGNDYCMARAANPADEWLYATPSFDFTPDVNSFTATDDALYILDNSGNLYTSADGAAWRSTGRRFDYLYGNYADQLIGSVKQGDTWYIVSYPSGAQSVAPADFPVRDSSQTVTHIFENATSAQMMIVGGTTQDGSLTNAAWGYDGNAWIRLSKVSIKQPLKNMSLLPYFTVSTNKTTWRTKRTSVMMAMNGQRADGKLNDTVYVSRDFGLTWAVADTLLTEPGHIPARTLAQTFNYVETISDNGTAPAKSRSYGKGTAPVWQIVFDGSYRLPLTPLATKPVTSWDCPYIYMFGGVDAQGNTYDTLYRGVINRFTFKPLQ